MVKTITGNEYLPVNSIQQKRRPQWAAFFITPNLHSRLTFVAVNQRMKNLFVLLLMVALTGCGSKKQYPPATDALNAGLQFIDGCLKGDFDKADFYMLQDDRNKQLLTEAKQKFKQLTKEQKKQLMEASLQNITIENPSVNETIIHYNNSFNNAPGKVKVVQTDSNKWLADFKYAFNPNL